MAPTSAAFTLERRATIESAVISGEQVFRERQLSRNLAQLKPEAASRAVFVVTSPECCACKRHTIYLVDGGANRKGDSPSGGTADISSAKTNRKLARIGPCIVVR